MIHAAIRTLAIAADHVLSQEQMVAAHVLIFGRTAAAIQAITNINRFDEIHFA
ncbi:putative uncharacterized protein [Parachlamydia acanthamoebae UV-7]|jgi:hypothetical protein|uniref:Uncharacterized protein n=2 Tax=Parachlamydia acanthamoebae TaxID=83552 RepID=F8KYL1_PARAV|nr:hypothetical protein pah_c050o160 [Parachlamydia acanthamoebae str. Hall's coccus]KIA78263.1 hypothetical protein DB43_EI00080 [Parachlamydia acanthamoebae]CCB85966.1 putative uncharacterized protein [Parachlamydia acanthamoebae UV-7]